MKLLAALAVLIGVAVTPSNAAAKDVTAMVVVGADGRSIRIQPERAVLGVMLHHPASVYDVLPEPALPHGGYVKLYPLGSGGFPAIPGRFYPTTGALCFSWDRISPAVVRATRVGAPSDRRYVPPHAVPRAIDGSPRASAREREPRRGCLPRLRPVRGVPPRPASRTLSYIRCELGRAARFAPTSPALPIASRAVRTWTPLSWRARDLAPCARGRSFLLDGRFRPPPRP